MKSAERVSIILVVGLFLFAVLAILAPILRPAPIMPTGDADTEGGGGQEEGLEDDLPEELVRNQNPSAHFTWSPEVPITGEETRFDASESRDADGVIQHYRWTFGTATSYLSSTPNVLHAFGLGGTVEVELTVVDNDGGENTTRTDVVVRGRLPVQVIASGPTGGWLEPHAFLINNVTHMEEVWEATLGRRSREPPDLPDIDFAEETVIAVFSGMRPSGGYSIVIREVISNDTALTVRVSPITANPYYFHSAVLTHPFQMARVDGVWANASFTFTHEVWHAEGQIGFATHALHYGIGSEVPFTVRNGLESLNISPTYDEPWAIYVETEGQWAPVESHPFAQTNVTLGPGESLGWSWTALTQADGANLAPVEAGFYRLDLFVLLESVALRLTIFFHLLESG